MSVFQSVSVSDLWSRGDKGLQTWERVSGAEGECALGIVRIRKTKRRVVLSHSAYYCQIVM